MTARQPRAPHAAGVAAALVDATADQPLRAPDAPAPTCVTCSDTAVAVTVTRLLPGGLAMVDTGEGADEEVSVALVTARVGDAVLVHAGEAIAVVAG